MDEEEPSLLERVADARDLEAETLRAVDLERFIAALWPEVCALPLKQRWAFLLHLERDEVLAFVQRGCCSLRQLAQLLEATPEEFVAWFGQLPLADDRIAERLGVTRRQVINLRKCARERLSRRLKMWRGDG